MRGLLDDLTLRPLRVEDARAAARVTSATDQTYLEWMPEGWKPSPESDELAHFAERFAEPGRWTLGGIEPGGRLVGFTSLRQAEDEDGGPIAGTGHLGDLFVHPDRWREGIATALLLLAEEEMRRRGYSRGRLRAPADAPALELYRSQGWAENGEILYLERYDLNTIGFSKTLDPEGA